MIVNVGCDCIDKCKNGCIRKAIKAGMHPTKDNVNRAASYPDDTHDGPYFDGIDFQTPVSQNSKIEKQNGIALKVFVWSDKTCVFVYILSEVTEYKRKLT